MTVLRGVPGEAAILLQQGFELYPLGDPGKKDGRPFRCRYFAQLEERARAQRRVLGFVTDSGTQFILQWTGK